MNNLPEPADPRSLRVSDADRDRAAGVLREAAGQGRITFDELDERLGLAYSARTYDFRATIGLFSRPRKDIAAGGGPRIIRPLATGIDWAWQATQPSW